MARSPPRARPCRTWDAELVGKRLVQAFATLDRLPRLRGPREPGGHWPRTVTEWADQLAQAELAESERRARQSVSNRTVIRPRPSRSSGWTRPSNGCANCATWTRNGAGDDPLGAALGAGALDKKALHRKAMGAAHIFPEAGEGARKPGADAECARQAGVLMRAPSFGADQLTAMPRSQSRLPIKVRSRLFRWIAELGWPLSFSSALRASSKIARMFATLPVWSMLGSR